MTGPFLGIDDSAPVFVISVAAQLAGMHPQTLRQYDRLGLVSPDRSAGRGRRYSARDIVLLREVQRLSQDEGVNLAGVKRVLELELQVEALQHRVSDLVAELDQARGTVRRVFAAGSTGVVPLRAGTRPERTVGSALVVWRPEVR